MIFILILMLFQLTYTVSTQAMANKIDYEKKNAVITAYILNTFTIEDEQKQTIAFQSDEKQYHENFKTIKLIWDAALKNNSPAFPARIKRKTDQETKTIIDVTQKASALEQYNVLCGYLKYQIKKDFDAEDKDQITQNRIVLKYAFNGENLDYLKSIQCYPGMMEEDFKSSINTYVEEEYKKLPNSSGWCIIF